MLDTKEIRSGRRDEIILSGPGWKRFVELDGGMKQNKVAGGGMDKVYVRPSL